MGLLTTIRRLFAAGEPQTKSAERMKRDAPPKDSSSSLREANVGFGWSLLEDKGYLAEIDRNLEMRLAPEPLPLPPATKRYVLFSTGDGWYDILDGDSKVGGIRKELGDEEHATIWAVKVKNVEYDFSSSKAARNWLGNPPVRRYR